MDSDDDRPAAKRYPSLVAFYSADGERLTSRERDVGLWWRTDEDGPMHRAAWIEATGELYLVRLGPAAEGGGGVEVIALCLRRGCAGARIARLARALRDARLAAVAAHPRGTAAPWRRGEETAPGLRVRLATARIAVQLPERSA